MKTQFCFVSWSLALQLKDKVVFLFGISWGLDSL